MTAELPRRCPQCGAPLPVETSVGSCPQCLLAGALEILTIAKDGDAEGDNLPASMPSTPFTGTKLRYFGDYELQEEIARGGMGVVFQARQLSLNRRVAIKFIGAGTFATPEAVQRFKTEAEAAASLAHPNIVPIYEIGEFQGQQYFSMGLIRGGNLATRLSASRSGLPVQESVSLIITVARAVHFAHQRGVLHRDLKPGNILLDENLAPHLTDFGVAKLVSRESNLTLTQTVLGTPNYMAPEQAKGNAREVTTAADIYSLGAVLYELLAGVPPFTGNTPLEVIRKVLDQEPKPPSSQNPAVDRDLDTICLKCLQKDRTQRYASAEALADDLERWQRHEAILARPVGNWEHAGKWIRRRPAVAALLGALVVAFAIGAAGVAWQWRRAENSAVALTENLYAADMGLAFQAWQADRTQRAVNLLDAWSRDGKARSSTFEWRFLRHLTRSQEIHRFQAPVPVPGGFWGGTLSPGQRWLATGGGDGLIEIWDLGTRRHLKTLHAAHARMYDIQFSPDGRWLANTVANPDPHLNGAIQLWDTASFNLKATLIGHAIMAMGVAFSPDGHTLASIHGWCYKTNDVQPIIIWNMDTGQERRRLLAHHSSTGPDASFSPDGTQLATPHGDGTILIWNLQTGAIQTTLTGHEGLVMAARFSPDGTQIASGGMDGTVRLWSVDDPSRGKIIGRHRKVVYSVAFSPDGSRLISSGLDATARLWDLQKCEELNCFRGHSDRIWTVAYADDGKQVATFSADGTARLWPAIRATRSTCDVYPSPTPGSSALSPDGRWLIFEGQLWSMSDMKSRGAMTGGLWTFSTDGRLLATLDGDVGLQIWDVDDTGPHAPRRISKRPQLTSWPRFSGDHRLLAAIDQTTNVVFWELPSGREHGLLTTGSSPLNQLALSPIAHEMATAHQDGNARLWNVKHRRLERTLEGHRSSILALAYSPDGHLLGTGSMDGTARLWDLASGQSHELASDDGWITAITFSADGQTLAVGTLAGEIKLWNVASRREMVTLEGHSTMLESLTFSADQQVLVSAGGTTLQIWHAPILPTPSSTHAEAW